MEEMLLHGEDRAQGLTAKVGQELEKSLEVPGAGNAKKGLLQINFKGRLWLRKLLKC